MKKQKLSPEALQKAANKTAHNIKPNQTLIAAELGVTGASVSGYMKRYKIKLPVERAAYFGLDVDNGN